MKKLLFNTLSILFLILISSCTKDESVETETLDVSGKWHLTEWTVKTPIDLFNDGEEATSFDPLCLNGSILEFFGEGSGDLFFYADVSYNTTYEDNNNLFIMMACSTSSDRLPVPISYINQENGYVVYAGQKTFNVTIEGDILYMVEENGLLAHDIDTNDVTISQDVTYIFTKE